MKFDTLDKKPQLYSLLIQGALVFLAVFFLLRGAGKNAAWISALLSLYTLAVIVQLIVAFCRQLRYNPYSYNTIIYMGFALFLLSLFIQLVLITLRILRSPEYASAETILHTLLGSAKNYMLLSFPFILIFSAALCVSNVSLIRHEGKRLVNVLGIILSFLLLAGEALLFFYDREASGSQKQVMIHDLFGNLFAAIYLYFECMLIGSIIAAVLVTRYEPEPDKDFLIILGCRIKKDGTPSGLLKGRIDRALAFYEKQKRETGRDLIFVTSGGQGPDEVIPESTCMKNYLTEHGIPEAQIIEEDRSTDTMENMRFSKKKIEAAGGGKVAFATTNYHVFRSGLCARRVKMRAVGIGAKTKWYYWPNASVRELVGLLTGHRGKQALLLGSLAAAYVIMTLIAYH